MRTPRRLGRVSLLAILTMLAGLILASPAHATFPGPNGRIAFADARAVRRDSFITTRGRPTVSAIRRD